METSNSLNLASLLIDVATAYILIHRIVSRVKIVRPTSAAYPRLRAVS